jgi:alanine racemase
MAYITLSRDNFFHNLNQIEKKVGSKDKIAVVLKDNAYGHGIIEMAKLAKEYGIKRAIVKNISEAESILEYFDSILSLKSTSKEHDSRVELTINSLRDFEYIKSGSKVHIKVDTGMHRNGLDSTELIKAFELIKQNGLVLKGILTHYRSADELSSELFWQKENFNAIKKIVANLCSEYGFDIPLFHSQASSATLRMNSFDDFVRVGIAAYGYVYLPDSIAMPDLRPVMSLWADKISTREIKQGDRVGYGGGYEARDSMSISTYDIGYGDGFFRLNENQKYYTKDNYQILGRVSMDNISVDSTDDSICIFDDVTKLSKVCNTITYEILVKLNPNINKKII